MICSGEGSISIVVGTGTDCGALGTDRPRDEVRISATFCANLLALTTTSVTDSICTTGFPVYNASFNVQHTRPTSTQYRSPGTEFTRALDSPMSFCRAPPFSLLESESEREDVGSPVLLICHMGLSFTVDIRLIPLIHSLLGLVNRGTSHRALTHYNGHAGTLGRLRQQASQASSMAYQQMI